MTLRYGSLFSGYGGLEMGVQSVLGGTTAWFCEFDKAPSKILAHHWPDVPNLGDITTVDWATVEPVDVLTGGFPCQDVSHAGRRAGLIRDGEGRTRSGLWGHMLRAIDELRPSLVVAENVRGLLSARADSDVEPCPWCMGDAEGEPHLRALGAVLADLADVGYDAWWVGLRAADVGAAHGRFRVFIFAWPADADGDGFQGIGRVGTEQRDADGLHRAGQAAADLTLLPTHLLPTPAVNDMGASYTPEEWDEWTATMQAKHGNGNGHGKSLSIEAQRLLPTPRTSDTNGAGAHGEGGPDLRTSAIQLLGTPTARDGKGSGQGERLEESARRGQVEAQVITSWGDYTAAIQRWEAVMGRPAPAPTEPGKNGNPRLSPRFVEWLMGLPAGHVTDPAIGVTRNDQLKALGNGVVPQQAAAATRALVEDMARAVVA